MKCIFFALMILATGLAKADWISQAQMDKDQRCFDDECSGHNRDFKELINYCYHMDDNVFPPRDFSHGPPGTPVMYINGPHSGRCYCRCALPSEVGF